MPHNTPPTASHSQNSDDVDSIFLDSIHSESNDQHHASSNVDSLYQREEQKSPLSEVSSEMESVHTEAQEMMGMHPADPVDGRIAKGVDGLIQALAQTSETIRKATETLSARKARPVTSSTEIDAARIRDMNSAFKDSILKSIASEDAAEQTTAQIHAKIDAMDAKMNARFDGLNIKLDAISDQQTRENEQLQSILQSLGDEFLSFQDRVIQQISSLQNTANPEPPSRTADMGPFKQTHPSASTSTPLSLRRVIPTIDTPHKRRRLGSEDSELEIVDIRTFGIHLPCGRKLFFQHGDRKVGIDLIPLETRQAVVLAVNNLLEKCASREKALRSNPSKWCIARKSIKKNAHNFTSYGEDYACQNCVDEGAVCFYRGAGDSFVARSYAPDDGPIWRKEM